MKKYIDYWVISDTGSTDGTQDLIKNFFKKEINLCEIIYIAAFASFPGGFLTFSK
mgnify:CR=1 FL=1